MNDAQLDDLKQFIDSRILESGERVTANLSHYVDSRVFQSEKNLTSSIDGLEARIDGRITSLEIHFDDQVTALESRLDNRIDTLEAKMDNGFAGIAEIIELHNAQSDNHEARITKLERHAA